MATIGIFNTYTNINLIYNDFYIFNIYKRHRYHDR